ncbi:hypothetical protein [Streptomyces sp. NPDC058434]
MRMIRSGAWQQWGGSPPPLTLTTITDGTMPRHQQEQNRGPTAGVKAPP